MANELYTLGRDYSSLTPPPMEVPIMNPDLLNTDFRVNFEDFVFYDGKNPTSIFKPKNEPLKSESKSLDKILKSKESIINDMYNAGINEGLSKALVCGILGNVMQESSFKNVTGDSGKSKGYFQMGYTEQKQYNNWKLSNSSRIAGKPECVRLMIYVCDIMKGKLGNYKPLNIYNIKKDVTFNSDDPRHTAADFMRRYEKPSAKYANLAARLNYAVKFYNYFS